MLGSEPEEGPLLPPSLAAGRERIWPDFCAGAGEGSFFEEEDFNGDLVTTEEVDEDDEVDERFVEVDEEEVIAVDKDVADVEIDAVDGGFNIASTDPTPPLAGFTVNGGTGSR